MEFFVNQSVLFQGFEYNILWIYENGQCEIRNDYIVRLVNLSDLQPTDHSQVIITNAK